MASSPYSRGHHLMSRKKPVESFPTRPVTPDLLCPNYNNNNVLDGKENLRPTPRGPRLGISSSAKRAPSVPRRFLNDEPMTDKNQQPIQRRRTLSGPRASLQMAESVASPLAPRKNGSKKESTVVVACRVRPFLGREKGNASVLDASSHPDREVQIAAGQGERRNLTFKFDKVFDHSTSRVEDPQEEVFEEIGQPLLESFLQGFNCTLFHYGQTGSGKTYSMMGTEDSPGILPRFCDWVFRRKGPELGSDASTVFLEISYFEIYNEEVFDLLSSEKRKALRVRNHDRTGPYVEGLLKKRVTSMDAIHEWLEIGKLNRATATTGMNERSSRSHAVFQLTLQQTLTENVDGVDNFFGCQSTVNLVDLAGSERSNTAQEGAVGIQQQGKRYKETVAINSSLTVLNRVIKALSDKSTSRKESIHVPYRESQLTWLLRDALGGNAKTSLLATISPCLSQREETISTLRMWRDPYESTESDEETVGIESPTQRVYKIRRNFDGEVDFKERFRFSRQQVEQLLLLIGKDLTFKTDRSKALEPKETLLLALRFYACGTFYYTNGDCHGVSKATVCRAVRKVTELLNSKLVPEIVAWSPEPIQEAKKFEEIAGLSRVCGCIDGTLIKIKAPSPKDIEPQFVDRKGEHSINCMVVCGPDMKILYASANWPGSVNDSRVLRNSSLGSNFTEGWRPFDGAYLLGDSGYPLKEWLLTPLLAANPTEAEQEYNRRHKKTRRLIECCFGILKNRFSCLNHLRVNPKFAGQIFMACCALHNLLLKESDFVYECDATDEPETQASAAPTNETDRNKGLKVIERIINSM